MSDLGHISGAAVFQYLAHAEDRGVDISQGLAIASITRNEISQPESRVDGIRFELLLDWLIEESGDTLFGLHTSSHVQPGSYSVMGYIAMNSNTIFEAYDKMVRYEKLVGDMGVSNALALPGSRFAIQWTCRYPRQPVRRHLIENVLASWVRYVRWLADAEHMSPLEVWLEHPAPLNDLSDYQAVFKCPIRFDQPYSAVITDLTTLSLPMRQPDSMLCSTLEAHAQTALSRLSESDSLSQRIKYYLHASIANQLPRKEQTAQAFELTERTLHRRLQAEGTSWQRLLDEVRQSVAEHYLKNTEESQADIAQRLGYTDIRSFQRHFKQRSGLTPGQWRQQH